LTVPSRRGGTTEREWSAEALAETTLEAYRKYDWDFVKVNPRATYYAEDWGTQYAQREGRQPDLIEPGELAADLQRIQPLDVTQGAYGEQLDSLKLIAEAWRTRRRSSRRCSRHWL
jgi:uroporphyrinogen decarboxylase